MRRKQISDLTRIRILAVEILKNQNPLKQLSASRLLVEPENYNELISVLNQFPNKVSKLLSSETKKDYNELDFHNLYPLSLDNELTWAKCILFRNSDYINSYIKYLNRYSSGLLKGNYKFAKNY